jgi:lipopolysaccharide cholinephosphotransferase
MEIDTRQAQQIMLEILLEIDRICKKYNITYWLDHGTLLGAVRHKGFIPWDDDLDISMLREDYEKFLQIAPKELNYKFFLQTQKTDKYYKNFFAKVRNNFTLYIDKAEVNKNIKYNQGIYIDIFPLNCIKKSNLKLFFYKNLIFLSKIFHNRFFKNIFITKFFVKIINSFHCKNYDKCDFIVSGGENMEYIIHVPKNYIFPLREVCFENYNFPVPNKYDLYLKSIFGDNYMQLPPQTKRKTHAIKILYKGENEKN